jgi:hypothetical protein
MAIRRLSKIFCAVLAVMMVCAGTTPALAQKATPKAAPVKSVPTTKAPAAKASPAAAAPATDAAAKAQIIGSARWRRAMFELNEWFTAQKLYTPEQVTKMKANFSAKVEAMSASELQFVLMDMEEKFQILDSKEAQEARAWLGNYMSVLTAKGRAEVLKRIPNFATMNAMQLQQAIAQLEQKRENVIQQQANVRQLRDSAPNPWTQNEAAAEQAYIRDHTMQRSAYSSPYRSGTGERPFDNVKTGPSMSISSGPWGSWVNIGM